MLSIKGHLFSYSFDCHFSVCLCLHRRFEGYRGWKGCKWMARKERSDKHNRKNWKERKRRKSERKRDLEKWLILRSWKNIFKEILSKSRFSSAVIRKPLELMTRLLLHFSALSSLEWQVWDGEARREGERKIVKNACNDQHEAMYKWCCELGVCCRL